MLQYALDMNGHVNEESRLSLVLCGAAFFVNVNEKKDTTQDGIHAVSATDTVTGRCAPIVSYHVNLSQQKRDRSWVGGRSETVKSRSVAASLPDTDPS